MTSVWTSSSVGAFEELRRRAASFADRVERRDQLLAFVGSQNARALQRPREGLRAADIGVDQAPIEMERAGEALEDFGGPARRSGRPRVSFRPLRSWRCFAAAAAAPAP